MRYTFEVPPRTSTLFLFAFSVSILLSAWLGYRETVINSDAICYLLSAQKVGTDGIRQAMHLCEQAKWPFYSVLIYGFVQLTHLTYPAAAYVLDGFFSLLSVAAFILIVKELGGSQRTLWLAAIIILLSHQFNSVREYIIRDHGFWAFYLCSILFLLKYARRPRIKFALGFSASLLFATLFRIEGAMFLLLLPFVTWFQKRYNLRQRARNFILLYLPVIILCGAIGFWLIIHPQQSLEKLGRVGELVNQFRHGLGIVIDRYHLAKSELGHSVLGAEAVDQAGIVIFCVWLVWYIISVIGNLSWIYALLALYAVRSRTIILRSTGPIILYWYVGINILVTGGFLAEHLFLSKRYLIALSLVLMLWVPFALNDIIRKWPSARHRMILGGAAILIIASSLGGIIDFGYSKTYVREAGDWLTQHVPAEASLYSNDTQLMYYSNHYGDQLFSQRQAFADLQRIQQGKWNQYDYLALRFEKKNLADAVPLLNEIQPLLVATYKNRRGDRVVIYKIPRGGSTS